MVHDARACHWVQLELFSLTWGACGLGIDMHNTRELLCPDAGEQVLVFLTKVTGISLLVGLRFALVLVSAQCVQNV